MELHKDNILGTKALGFDSDFLNSAGVYILVNRVNGIMYVGESVNIRLRMKEHLYVKTQVISKAITKHGADNFLVYVEY